MEWHSPMQSKTSFSKIETLIRKTNHKKSNGTKITNQIYFCNYISHNKQLPPRMHSRRNDERTKTSNIWSISKKKKK